MRVFLFVAVLVVLAGCAGGVVPADYVAPAVRWTPGELGSPAPDTGPIDRATVTRVVNGDILVVRLADCCEETVRLPGADTPEVNCKNTPDEYEGVPESAAGCECLRSHGNGEDSGLAPEVLHVDGNQFHAHLVADEWARVSDTGIIELDRYLGLERRAQTDRQGLWGCADGTPAPTTA